MGKQVYFQGPVSKRTRSKEAEYYRQYHVEYKKKKEVEEKSVTQTTESTSSCGTNWTDDDSEDSSDHDIEVFEISDDDDDDDDLERDKKNEVKGEKNTCVESKGESSNKKSRDEESDDDVDICEISDECADDSDKDQTNEPTKDKNKFVRRKAESCNEKSVDEESVENAWDEQATVENHIRATRTTFDVAKVPADSILENPEIPNEEKRQPSTNLSLPLKFTLGIDESTPLEKSEQGKDLDELWSEMDISICESVAENRKGESLNKRSGDEKSDHDVGICEISDECAEDSERNQTNKARKRKKTFEKRKAESCNKKSGDEECAEDARNEQATVRKRIRATRTTFDVAKDLVESILENSEIRSEEKKQPSTNLSLPLKFTFGIEESTPPEKSEEEKDLDELWSEMDISLCEIVAENTLLFDGAPAVKPGRDTLCDRDNHCFIVDEEIGLKCKYCFFVKTEIKYLTVPFSENPFERSGRRGSYTVEHNTLEDFNSHGIADCPGSTHDPHLLEKGTVWGIIPGIENGMHQHQKEGFEFLWRNIAGDIHLEKLKEGSAGGGSGCIISHAPGTGKTRLTIAFLQTYLKQYPLCRALIIAPCGMLLTWEAEFKKWNVEIPFYNLNNIELSGKENVSALKLASRSNSAKEKLTRMAKLCSWTNGRGILGMSYRRFQELIGGGRKRNAEEGVADKIRKIILEQTGLIVLDEGHTARNDDSLIWQALSKMRTGKRIILSGTPFQNNFDELYNILWLVRPKFAKKIPYKHYKLSKRRGCRKRSEAKEVWGSLTDQISREKNERLTAQTLVQLKEVIGPFVHIHNGNILQEKLPGLRDSLIVLEPCQLQKNLLVEAEKMNLSRFLKEHLISVLSVHPSLLLDIGFDLKKFGHNLDGLESNLRHLRFNPEVGIKTKFLKAFIWLCQAVKERVLVFSQYIDPLGFIIDQLKSQFRWSEGREILCIQGKLNVEKRQQLIKDFNDPKSEAKVLFASIRTCSEGINLIGASRVVLLDVVWNPSVERQAISRAYRLGQERVVHIYHLITSGTMEEEKYCRQVAKDRLSDLLFYAADKAGDLQKTSSDLRDGGRDEIIKRMIDQERLKDMFKEIIHQPKYTNLIESFGFVES